VTPSPLRPEDLHFLCALLHDRTGVVVDASKDYLIDARLAALAGDEGLEGVAELVAKLRSGNHGRLRQRFADAMLTKETSFFRDLTPFLALESSIVPDLLRQRQRERRLVVWSAGCSTGQEIYSVVMLILEHFPELRSWSLEMLASDISEEALGRARSGSYSLLEVNRGLPVAMLLKYFKQNEMEWQLRDEAKDMVSFFQLNLVQPWPVLPPVDLLLMRNVLIYLDVAARQRVMERVRQALRPNGYLILGSAESSLGADAPFVPTHIKQTVVYRQRHARGDKR
jgi:chemotaxis protein methyltransferase CheR